MSSYWPSATGSVRVAYRVALVLGCLGLLSMLWNPLAGGLVGLVHFLFAWGIRRGQSGAALAAGCFALLPSVIVALHWSEDSHGAGVVWPLISVAVAALVAAFFVPAAVALWRDRSASRVVWPWGGLAFFLIAPWMVLHPYVVAAGSMANTLLPGDYLLTETVSPHLARPLWNGEVLAIHYPLDRKQIFIKRVVGVPGDRIRIVNKQLYRNGVAVSEPYALHGSDYLDSFRDNFPSAPNTALPAPALDMLHNHVRDGELVVPEGRYFVLGDNRDNSLDSRYWGFLSKADVYGRPMLIYGSVESGGTTGGAMPSVFNTRWGRLLRRP